MKYKIIGITACILVVIFSVFLGLCCDENERVHQHLVAKEKLPCSHDESIFCTHLPLVQIDTAGEKIPGKGIIDPITGVGVVSTAKNGADFITSVIKVTDHLEKNNHTDDLPDVESLAEINIRGVTSKYFDKPNYAIRLVNKDGTNNPQALMGMDSHHEWTLHGPCLDKTLMQNYIWYNIAGSIMDYAPNVRFCELMINGEYQGVYLLTETITAGKNARLELSASRKNNTVSGYLVRLDRGRKAPIKNLNTFSRYTYRSPTILNIEYPGSANLTQEMSDEIKRDFSKFEKSLYSFDFDDKKFGYRSQVDVDSFIDFFLINEFSGNYDAGMYSTYIYLDTDKRYRTCVWDFNLACGGYNEESSNGRELTRLHQKLWYEMLFKDEYFVDRLIDRYRYLRTSWLSEEYLNQYIDDTAEYLGPAIERNYEKWGYLFEPEHDFFTEEKRNPRSFEEAVHKVKKYIRRHGDWLDENIDSLRQYCADSKVKPYKEHTD